MIFLKIVLLLLYLVLLITVFRIVDYIAWSDASSVVTLVDPIELSLRQLRWLLHARGINYHSAIEKKDLSDLVSASGVLSSTSVIDCITDSSQGKEVLAKEEIKAAEDLESYSSCDTKTFSSESDLTESIDKTEYIWLVQIVSERSRPILPNSEWKKLSKRMKSVGIHTGQIFCQQTPNICSSHSFLTSQLMISYHYKKNSKGIHKKHYLTRKTDANSVYNWIAKALHGCVEQIPDSTYLQQDWLSSKARTTASTQVVYVSKSDEIPVAFASLKMKFKDHIRFGKLQWKEETSKLKALLRSKTDLPDTFLCLITRRQTYVFGNGRPKEMLHYSTLYMFLLNVYPDVNLLFTWSVYVCNMLATLSFFTSSNNIFSRVVSVFKSFLAYNAVLLGFWLYFSSYKPYVVGVLTDSIFSYIQLSATMEGAAVLRHYLALLSHFPVSVLFGFTIFFCVVLYTLQKFKVVSSDPDTDTDLSDILLSRDNRFVADNDISRRWIERLATPGLWLQPLVPSDYIDNLPVWEYSGDCSSSSESDEECQAPATRTASTSPSRTWMQSCGSLPRGRACASALRRASNIHRGLLLSIRSCLRGRSPRIRKTSGPPVGMREERSCSICLDNYKQGSSLCGLPCGHVFHRDCILPWLHGEQHCCPFCRWPAYQSKNLQNN